MKSKKQTKMVEHKLVSFGAVVALWTLTTLLIKLIRILLKWKYNTRQKLRHFGRYVAKAKLFCLKTLVPVTQAGVFIWENFLPGYRDLGNRASPASHMNTSKCLRRKDWRGEISVSVDRAHTKRPSVAKIVEQQLFQIISCKFESHFF